MKIKVDDPNIYKKAVALTLMFAEESDIPDSFLKSKTDKIDGINIFKKNGRRFLKHVLAWIETIQAILDNIEDEQQAWRFITLSPAVGPEAKVTECKDFLDFTDFLDERRSANNSTPDEIGGLCMLHTEFQNVIQRTIATNSQSVLS